MIEKIKKAIEDINNFSVTNKDDLEQFRLKYLSKKGLVTEMFGELKEVAADKRKEVGQYINELKNIAQNKIDAIKDTLETTKDTQESIDLTAPCECEMLGSRHPISLVQNEMCRIFERIGFTIADGPEIEDDWHLFSALNFPPEHPARDMQDTFFVEQKPDICLRTH